MPRRFGRTGERSDFQNAGVFYKLPDAAQRTQRLIVAENISVLAQKRSFNRAPLPALKRLS